MGHQSGYITTAAVALVVALLPGCATAVPEGFPQGTVAVGRDLYQVPISVDDGGCVRYTLMSTDWERRIPAGIWYREPGGDFTQDYDRADCEQLELDVWGHPVTPEQASDPDTAITANSADTDQGVAHE